MNCVLRFVFSPDAVPAPSYRGLALARVTSLHARLRLTMTSICNYSHPELQITEGLIRQTSGTLFPYNPEFYKLASGLRAGGHLQLVSAPGISHRQLVLP